MVVGSFCFLALCANQTPSEKTSSLTGTFAQANPSPTYCDRETGTDFGHFEDPAQPF